MTASLPILILSSTNQEYSAGPFSREGKACRILNRLQRMIKGVNEASSQEQSKVEKALALDAELRSLNIPIPSEHDTTTWRGDFAVSAVSSLFMFNYLNTQEEILATIDSLAKMVNRQLELTTENEGHGDSLPPYAIPIVALGADAFKNLRSIEIGEEYARNQQRVFVELLRRLSVRWKLSEAYLGIIEMLW
ncbi:hypothetical protein BJX70DRAFT_401039 [Aspergillus crustosus]